MSIQSRFRIRFLIDIGTNFGSILVAKTGSVACIGDPPFGGGALGASKNEVKTLHPIFIPLRHRFRSDFHSILKEIFLKPCVYKPCSVVHSDQLRRRPTSRQASPS